MSAFAHYGVRECWLVHQLKRELEVLQFSQGQVLSRNTYGGVETIKSSVLPFFDLSPEVLAGWG